MISTIATIHRATIAKVNRGHRAYGRTEIVGTSILRQTVNKTLGQAVPEYEPYVEPSSDDSSRICSTTFRGIACL